MVPCGSEIWFLYFKGHLTTEKLEAMSPMRRLLQLSGWESRVVWSIAVTVETERNSCWQRRKGTFQQENSTSKAMEVGGVACSWNMQFLYMVVIILSLHMKFDHLLKMLYNYFPYCCIVFITICFLRLTTIALSLSNLGIINWFVLGANIINVSRTVLNCISPQSHPPTHFPPSLPPHYIFELFFRDRFPEVGLLGT